MASATSHHELYALRKAHAVTAQNCRTPLSINNDSNSHSDAATQLSTNVHQENVDLGMRPSSHVAYFESELRGALRPWPLNCKLCKFSACGISSSCQEHPFINYGAHSTNWGVIYLHLPCRNSIKLDVSGIFHAWLTSLDGTDRQTDGRTDCNTWSKLLWEGRIKTITVRC